MRGGRRFRHGGAMGGFVGDRRPRQISYADIFVGSPSRRRQLERHHCDDADSVSEVSEVSGFCTVPIFPFFLLSRARLFLQI
jgi:hypothetical protein